MNDRISAVIITKNEASNILACVHSLKEIADEILVIDSFSNDNTVELALNEGCTVVQREWEGYSNTKNWGNNLAKYNWILSIDADEVLSESLQKDIRHKKKLGLSGVYSLNRLTNYCGKMIKSCGWYPEYKIRLFKKDEASWQGSIHEDLVFSERIKITKLNGDLFHYSYPTVEFHVKKIFSYAKLAAEKDFKKGKRYTFLMNGLGKPLFVFFKKFIFQYGIKDGKIGFTISAISAFERFMRYHYYVELKK